MLREKFVFSFVFVEYRRAGRLTGVDSCGTVLNRSIPSRLCNTLVAFGFCSSNGPSVQMLTTRKKYISCKIISSITLLELK
ncbi:hypothetical protein TNCV_1102871 [Trichonephila clavipes]|nr:hypothetical protein TNCV_1102871 [Trichonephila clavipes]